MLNELIINFCSLFIKFKFEPNEVKSETQIDFFIDFVNKYYDLYEAQYFIYLFSISCTDKVEETINIIQKMRANSFLYCLSFWNEFDFKIENNILVSNIVEKHNEKEKIHRDKIVLNWEITVDGSYRPLTNQPIINRFDFYVFVSYLIYYTVLNTFFNSFISFFTWFLC